MRNLKRVLSLGMTAAMITGLMVVGTSAAGYSDVSTEDNVEAIEVLQSVGVMVGDENGDFNPDQLVTRNEMAVVMSNLMEYNVATYSGTSPFTDVPSWAEPYVAACWTNGITAGTSATTYGGDQSVTTAQAALMLMKALGYFQYDSDFNGDWQLATITQGNRISLFKNVESNVRDAMTRNDVAQLVLNTLESGMVEPNKTGQDITIGDITITNGVEYQYVTSTESYARAIDNARPQNTATSISTDGCIVELGEKLYDGDLRRTENTEDAYGRPGTRWVYNLNEVGTYSDAPLATYTNKVTKGDLYSLVSKARLDDIRNYNKTGDAADVYEYYFNVWVDGQNVEKDKRGGAFTNDLRNTYFLSNSSAAAGEKDTNAVSGKGVQTEVYLDDDGNLTLVYINTYLMQATADYNENKDTLSVDVLTAPADYEKGAANITVSQLNGDDFDIDSYSEDEYILYTVADGQVEDIYPAQVVTGEVTAYSLEDSVTLDSTKYDYAAKVEGTKADGDVAGTGSVATEYRVGDNAAVVLDQAGYVLYVDSAEISLGNYLYVYNTVAGSGLASNYVSKVYFTDGTTAEVTLNKVDGMSGSDIGEAIKGATNINQDLDHDGVADAKNLNGWYSYSVNSSDKYTLTSAKTDDVVKNVTKLEGEKVEFVNGLYGNSSTVLIVDDGDDVTVYTGINNFPDITATKGASFDVCYFLEKDSSSKTYVSVAFVDADNDDITVDDNTTDSLLYILKRDSRYVDDADNETIEVWNAILDGQETQIKAKAGEFTAYNLYSKYSIDSDGYYESQELAEDSTKNTYETDDLSIYSGAAKDAEATISVSGGSLSISKNGEKVDRNFIITDDTKIFVVLYPTGSNTSAVRNDMMTDPDADYEVMSVTGRRLDSLLGDYSIRGSYTLVLEDDDSSVVESIYVTVKGAVEIPD